MQSTEYMTNNDRHPMSVGYRAPIPIAKCKQIHVVSSKTSFSPTAKKGTFELEVPNRKIGQRDFLKWKALTFWLGTSISPNSCTQLHICPEANFQISTFNFQLAQVRPLEKAGAITRDQRCVNIERHIRFRGKAYPFLYTITFLPPGIFFRRGFLFKNRFYLPHYQY